MVLPRVLPKKRQAAVSFINQDSPIVVPDEVDGLVVVGPPGDDGQLLEEAPGLGVELRLAVEPRRSALLHDDVLGLVAELQTRACNRKTRLFTHTHDLVLLWSRP